MLDAAASKVADSAAPGAPGATCGIFLLSGLTLPTSELAAAAFRVREHAAIQGVNLVVLPLVMWSVTLLLGARISTTPRSLLTRSRAPPGMYYHQFTVNSLGGATARLPTLASWGWLSRLLAALRK